MSKSQRTISNLVVTFLVVTSTIFVVWGVIKNKEVPTPPAPKPPLTKEEYRDKMEQKSVAFSDVVVKTGPFPNGTVEEEGGTPRIRMSHGKIQLRFYLDHYPMEGHKYVVIAFHKYKWNGKFWVVINGEKGGFWTPEYRPEGVAMIEISNPSQLKLGWNVIDIVVPEGYGPQEFWNLRFHVMF